MSFSGWLWSWPDFPVVVLFAVPLAVMVRSAFFTEERGELERAALAAALRVGPQFASGDQVELPVLAHRSPATFTLLLPGDPVSSPPPGGGSSPHG